jgi:hypothetical protein
LALGVLLIVSLAAGAAHFATRKTASQKVLVVHIREKDILPSSYSATMAFSLQRPKFLLFGKHSILRICREFNLHTHIKHLT